MVINNVTRVKQTGSVSDSGVSYDETYHVYYTGAYSAVALVNTTDSRLPRKWSDMPGDSRAYASAIKIENADDSDYTGDSTTNSIAVYSVTYSQKSITFDPNPMNRPADIEWGGGIGINEVVQVDVTGARLENSAKDLYESIPERPIRGSRCSITRNESANPAANVNAFSNTINKAAWYGVPIGNGFMGEITARKVTEPYNGQSLSYYVVTYPILLRRDGWAFKPIDNGYSKLVSGTKQVHTDDMGNTAPVPILLDGSGGKLADGGTPVVYPTAGYKVNEESVWATLNLPNPFL